MMMGGLVVLLLVVVGLFGGGNGYSDFVASVECEAEGMRIELKETLPTPRNGMWDLEVEGFPDCPAVTKTDVGGGHSFLIPFKEKELCGVDAEYVMTPKRLAQARTILLLKDDNGTMIADSVSCVYKTKFHSSLLSYSGEVRSENLIYGGSLEEEGSDVEATVRAADAVSMEFYGATGKPLKQRNVRLGDDLIFRISVGEKDQVSQILPESCYFSSSRQPAETALAARTLPFVRKACFNSKDGMVRAFLAPMQRRENGTVFEMPFPAFYFTGHGQNLYVHCTVLACVGTEDDLCTPHPNCFSSPERRRKRRSLLSSSTKVHSQPGRPDELVMTKYIIVQDSRRTQHKESGAKTEGGVCVRSEWAMGGLALGVVLLLCLLGAMSLLLARLSKQSRQARWVAERAIYGGGMGKAPAYDEMRDASSSLSLTKLQPSSLAF